MTASQRSENNLPSASSSDSATPEITSDQPSLSGALLPEAMWQGHGGWEIALTPALFGFAGWRLDVLLNTTPLLVILLATLGLFGAVANQYYRYTARMELAAQERRAALDAQSAELDAAAARATAESNARAAAVEAEVAALLEDRS